jgi:hypothetical protein
MSPLIPDGSTLTVRFGRSGLVPGDVILYATDAHLIAHRVLRLGRGGRRWGWLKVKGDPLHAGEASWIPVEEVVGRVVALRRPDGGRFVLNSSSGRLAGRIAALISGPCAWGESKALALAGLPRRMVLTRLLLRAPGLLYGRGGQERGGGSGLPLDASRRFLLRAARLNPREEDLRALAIMLRRELPWEGIAPTAVRLGLAPLVYRNLLEDRFAGSVPPAALAMLRKGAHGAACLMAIQMEGLERVDTALREKGIRPVLLKGTALAVTLYEQPALRRMQDLDLLVRSDEVEPALEALRAIGFRGILSDRGPSFYASHHHALPMIDSRGRLIVEIHRGLVPPSAGLAVETGPLLDRAVEVIRDGRSYRVLALEDQILHAALHLAHTDRFMGRLRDLLDIHALLEATPSPDWGVLIEASRSWSASRSLYSTLDLGRRLLGTRVPREVLSELARGARWDPVAAGVVRVVGGWSLFEGGGGGRIVSDSVIKSVCDSLLRRSRWPERVRMLAASLGPTARLAI